MIVLVAFALLVVSIPASGGSLRRVGDLRLRAPWLIAATFLGQFLVTDVFADRLGGPVGGALHIASYVAAFVFMLLNVRVTGLWLVVLGGAMNFAAIAANGGVMPTTEWALENAGIEAAAEGEFRNSGKVDDTELLLLGDVLVWPEPLPFHNVLSVGDLVLVVGVGVVLHVHGRREPDHDGSAPGDPDGVSVGGDRSPPLERGGDEEG